MQRNAEFTIRDMMFLLRKRIALIFTVTILVVFLSFVYSMCLVQPVYECTTTFIVSVDQIGISSAKTSAQIADTFGYILKNQSLLKTVVEKFGINISTAKLAANIDFMEIEASGIYLLTVRAGNYNLAGGITDAVIECVPEEISRSFKTGSIEIITLSKDTEQVSPNILNNTVAGFFIGFALSCVLSLLTELMNNRFRTNEDIKNKLDYPVIGIIPKFSSSAKTLSKPGGEEHLTESFSALKTVLYHALLKKPARKILIASPLPGDGKTTVALNLASALGSNDRKILLVDADFRNPGLGGVLWPDDPYQKGLSAVLSNTAILSDCVRSFSGITVLPSGRAPDKPNELLQSGAMSAFLEEAESRYDTILFDTPPMTAYSDAVTLLPQTDGAIFVVRHNYTTFEAAVFAKERLEMVSTAVIGCVMNAFDSKVTNKIYTYDPPVRYERSKSAYNLKAAFLSAKSYIETKLPKRP